MIIDFVMELMRRNGVCDTTYAETTSLLGKPGTVEPTALAGYFVMVCWVMNVDRTPGPIDSKTPALSAVPG